MFDNDAPLNRIKGETRKSNDALHDYWLLGPGRSLAKLRQIYGKSAVKPPTIHIRTLEVWSSGNFWQVRISAQKDIDDAQALEAYQGRHMGRDEVLALLADQARGDMAEFANIDGSSDLAEVINSHIIKKLIVTERLDKDGEVVSVKTHLELYDAQKALVDIGKNQGLFKEKLDITSGGQPFSIDDLSEAKKDLAAWKAANEPDSDYPSD